LFFLLLEDHRLSGYIKLKSHFKTTLSRDVSDMILGAHIATGATRMVYAHATQSDAVVKLENIANSFCNIYEEQVWYHVKDTEFAQWFAPVLRISPNGTVLVMRRTMPVSINDLPKHVPAFFTDLKAENFGRMDGRIVCHDYGFHRFIERGMTKKMRLANWEAKETKA